MGRLHFRNKVRINVKRATDLAELHSGNRRGLLIRIDDFCYEVLIRSPNYGQILRKVKGAVDNGTDLKVVASRFYAVRKDGASWHLPPECDHEEIFYGKQ
jgi:hypothetical protein